MGTARRRRRHRRPRGGANDAQDARAPGHRDGTKDATPALQPRREAEGRSEQPPWADEPVPRPATLEALARLAETSRALRRAEWAWLAQAREEGHSWTEIGAALGIARSSARERLTRRRLTR